MIWKQVKNLHPCLVLLANPVKFITQIWQPGNIQSDMGNISNYATAQAKVPMRQVTFSSTASKQQIKRKQKSHGNVCPGGDTDF